MKATITTILFLIGMITISHAQTSASAYLGATFYNVHINGVSDQILPNTVLKPGFQAGLEIEKSIDSRLSFISGVGYMEKGFIASEGFNINILKIPIEIGMKAETELKYLEVPIMLKYTFVNSHTLTPYASLGLVGGYLMDADIKTKASAIIDFNISQHDINLTNELYNRWEVGARGGIGISAQTTQGRFYLEGSAQLGLTDMLRDPIVDIRLKNQGMQFRAGYTYNF